MSEQRMYPGMSPDAKTTFAPYSAFDIPADLRELHGRYDVEATARRVRNFRYAEEWMMMIGGWVATIPELPVKTGLSKVIWETAQAADEFGKRLLCDDPTIEILDTIVRKRRRHISWGMEILDRLCDTDALRERRRARVRELSAQLRASGGVTGTLDGAGSPLNH